MQKIRMETRKRKIEFGRGSRKELKENKIEVAKVVKRRKRKNTVVKLIDQNVESNLRDVISKCILTNGVLQNLQKDINFMDKRQTRHAGRKVVLRTLEHLSVPKRAGMRSQNEKYYLTLNNDTPIQIAKKFELDVSTIVAANLSTYPTMTKTCKLRANTLINLDVEMDMLHKMLAEWESQIVSHNSGGMTLEDVNCARNHVLKKHCETPPLNKLLLASDLAKISPPSKPIDRISSVPITKPIDNPRSAQLPVPLDNNGIVKSEFVPIETPPEEIQRVVKAVAIPPAMEPVATVPPQNAYRVKSTCSMVTRSSTTLQEQTESRGSCECTACSLPDDEFCFTSGISYVAPCIMAQEKQSNISPLSPLVLRPSLDPAPCRDKMNSIYHVIAKEPVVTLCIESDTGENCIKEYLRCLGNESQEFLDAHYLQNADHRVCWASIHKLQQQLQLHNHFSCLHYKLEVKDDEWQIHPVNRVRDLSSSNLQIGCLMRKGKAGTGDRISANLVDQQLAAANPWMFEEFSRLTLSVRLELYIETGLWESLALTIKRELMRFIRVTELHMSQRFLKWNNVALRRLCNDDDYPLRYGPRRIMSALSPILISTNPQNASIEAEVKVVLDDLISKLASMVDQYSTPKKKVHQKHPLYLIGTRDCFSHSLIGIGTGTFTIHQGEKTKKLHALAETETVDDRAIIAIDWFLNPEQGLPAGYDTHRYPIDTKTGLYPIGIRTYTNIFSEAEVMDIEKRVDGLYDASLQSHTYLRPNTCHHTARYMEKTSRTKMFFNARYLWTKEQMEEMGANYAGGIRCDVSPSPSWMDRQLREPLERRKIVPSNFVNSYACNIYHDGSEGLAQHYDDIGRFAHPVISLRLFSDSRLSFGCKLYGFSNGAFSVPMPRGAVTVLLDSGYAANEIKHCIRPVDMAGKSGVLLLRRIHESLLAQARSLEIDNTSGYFQAMDLDSEFWTNKFALQFRRNTEGDINPYVAKFLDKLIRKVEKNVTGVSTTYYGAKTRPRKEEDTVHDILRGIIRQVVSLDRHRKEEERITKQCSKSLDGIIQYIQRQHEYTMYAERLDRERTNMWIRSQCQSVLYDIISTIVFQNAPPVVTKPTPAPKKLTGYGLFRNECIPKFRSMGVPRNEFTKACREAWEALTTAERLDYVKIAKENGDISRSATNGSHTEAV